LTRFTCGKQIGHVDFDEVGLLFDYEAVDDFE
jgi:hypothetical protein